MQTIDVVFNGLFTSQCVVIGLQSTGEARTLEALEEGGGELNDFVSTAKYVFGHGNLFSMTQSWETPRYLILMCFYSCRGVLQSLIEKHFPAPDRQKLYSLLGIDLPSKKAASSSDTAAQLEQKGKKRKGMESRSANVKSCNYNVTFDNFLLSGTLLTFLAPESKKQQKKKPRKHGGLSGTSSEESQSEESDKESSKDCDSDDSFKSVSSADEDDDFNPFRDESDDDEEDGKIISQVLKKTEEKEQP